MKRIGTIYRTLFVSVWCACIGIAATGCTTDETDFGPAAGTFSIRSEAVPMSPATRATTFDEGTEYALWIVSDGDWKSLRVEDGHIQSDAGGEFEQTKPNTFMGILDFYALTWGTDRAPEYEKDPQTAEPLFIHRRGYLDMLPDLRRAERTGCTAANTGGRVVLPFKHTLVKLRYELFRQDTEELEGARITDIKVLDHSRGTLNVATGQYTYPDEERKRYNVLPQSLAADGVEVTTTPRELRDENGPVETLVFPNDFGNGEYLTVSITVRKKDGTFYTTEDYRIPMGVAEGDEVVERPFQFLPNHEYVLQLTVMNDRVRIVAIVPQKYDWIENTDPDQPLGNPIVFDNTAWLDRNLGALGYDITSEESFAETVGYFYQTCRNIPYWPFYNENKSSHYTDGIPRSADRYKVPLDRYVTDWSNTKYRPYPFVSDKLQEYLNVGSGEWTDQGGFRVYSIIEPDSAQKIKAQDGSFSFRTGKNNPWWTGNQGKDATAVRYSGERVPYAEYWDNPDDQPAPPGWAIPTAEQFRTIFPATPFAGNITFCDHGYGDPSNWNDDNQTHPMFPDTLGAIRLCVPYYRNGGEARKGFWTEFDGDIGCIPETGRYRGGNGPGAGGNIKYEPEGDPAPGYHSVYIISREGDDAFDLSGYGGRIQEIGTIYAIKKVNTPEAYRMRWKVFDATKTPSKTAIPRLYVQVNIYDCPAGANLTPENYRSEEFDWEHPSASMNFPLSGLQDGKEKPRYCYYGSEVIYATSEVNDDNSTPVLRMKLWGKNENRNVYMAIVDEQVNHGKQIRLVRR